MTKPLRRSPNSHFNINYKRKIITTVTDFNILCVSTMQNFFKRIKPVFYSANQWTLPPLGAGSKCTTFMLLVLMSPCPKFLLIAGVTGFDS
jgi:hypothetical protein